MKLPALFVVLVLVGCVAEPPVDNATAVPKGLDDRRPVTVIPSVPASSAVRAIQEKFPPSTPSALLQRSPETVQSQVVGKYGTASFVGHCGGKRHCTQMQSCEEARFYLTECGLSKLDKDHDGIPCESMCGN